MILERTVAPTGLPVSLADAKAHCRVVGSEDDALLSRLIRAATEYLDGPRGVLGQCLLTQTWQLKLRCWPDAIVLPVEPVQSVVVEYLAPGGTWQTLTGWTLVADWRRCPIVEPPDSGWPTLGDSELYRVRLTIVAGAPAVADDVVHAILLLVGHWYAEREAAGPDTRAEVPLAFRALLSRTRRVAL